MSVSKIKKSLASLILALFIVFGVSMGIASANAVTDGCDSKNANECVCPQGTTDTNCGQDPVFSSKGSLNCPGQADPTKDCTIITKYVNPLIKLLGFIVGVAVVIGLIVGGIQYSSAGGDPQKIAGAKKHIRNSIIALLAFMLMYAILKFLIPGAGVPGGGIG